MPIKKKKLLKKKKKNIASSLFPKKIPKYNIKHQSVINSSNACRNSAKKFNYSCRSKINIEKNDGIHRTLSPFQGNFNKNNKCSVYNKLKTYKMPQSSSPGGLSPKEKSYVICRCQSKSSRYMKLKKLAADAIKNNKIFSIYGNCNAVRKALLERGWIEKIAPNRMNLSKIRNGTYSSKTDIHGELERLLLSNLVEKYGPSFVWHTKEEQRDTTIDMTVEYNSIVNKLKMDTMWTTKQGLCSSMKRNYWFYIEDIAEVNGPRTYNSYDSGETEGFIKDYKITACTSLLKWILSMVANEREIFNENGKISLNVVVFALNRCKEYLYRMQHKDIDQPLRIISSGQWNAFLKKYYRIIAKEEVFQSDKENTLPLYLGYAKFLLKEIHKFRPQLSCEGCHDIWIIKPPHCSRGRGIRLASKLAVITNLLSKANEKYVIQKYIEEPLLIYDTKFDIRQYYLVTSTYPLIIWMYKDCYLKFCSQKYNLKNYHESIHLTNNAVQRRYKNCEDRHTDLPTNNMWDLDKYKDYLNRIGKNKVWDKIIYTGMKKSIISIMLNCQDSMSICKNRFELYGCDFILDKEYKPWLIEINSCPDLNHTTQVTAKICPAVVSDIIKVVVDRASNPRASIGKFECIYHQPMTLPRYGGATDLTVRGYTLPMEYFYKGNIEVKESYYDPSIGKERNINSILTKLKEHYDSDIMVEPDDDNDTNKRQEKETYTHHTHSECELNVTATIITEQLDELLDRMTSEYSYSTRSNCNGNISSSPRKSLNSNLSTKSLTDFKSLLKTSLNHCASSEKLNIKRSFNFSKLDDGPLGKGSCTDFSNIKNVFTVIFKKITNQNQLVQSSTACNSKCNYIDPAVNVTSKILSFIRKRQEEYT